MKCTHTHRQDVLDNVKEMETKLDKRDAEMETMKAEMDAMNADMKLTKEDTTQLKAEMEKRWRVVPSLMLWLKQSVTCPTH